MSIMKKIQYIFVVASILVGGPVLAGEPTKEELTSNIKALTWEFQYLQERAKTIQTEAQVLQQKLQAIEAKEKENKEKKK